MVLKFTIIFFIWIFARNALADCQYWDGTAPFCDGSCPSNCRTLGTSDTGNGGSCWSGSKALCDCCAGPGPCNPTETITACYGLVLICKNIELVFGPTGQQSITCSSYACGACVGFTGLFGDEENMASSPRGVLSVHSTHRDVIVRGLNTTEEEMEDTLVSRFGKKLSSHEMKKTTALHFVQPDIAQIRRYERCYLRESASLPEDRLRLQSPRPYHK
jgi:hypothetical protein